MSSTRSQNLALIIILIGFSAIALLYVRAVPIFENSDEAEHTLFIHTILESGALPVIQSREQMAEKEDPVERWNNQSHHAPLYYLVGAGLVSWSQRDDIRDYLRANELIFLRNTVENNPNKWLHPATAPTGDTHLAVYTLRIFSVIIGCGTLALVYLASKQIFPDSWLPLLVTAFAASIPTFIVVNSSVSNDAPVIFFYTAGVLWSLRIWRLQRIRWRDTLLISLILSGIALTKLTGVSLYGIVFVVLFAGAWRGFWNWREAVRHFALSLAIVAVLAGWWYLRNWQIYGDPLALAATASIWGRKTPLTLPVFVEDLRRIGQSFWLLIGYLHYPIYAPQAFYGYAAVLSLLGIGGMIGASIGAKPRFRRDVLAILLLVCGLVAFMLLWGTRSVDISYGRLLLPALAAFAPLLVFGWWMIARRLAWLLILPLLALSIITPLQTVPQAYSTLEAVSQIPDGSVGVEWRSDGFEIVALAIPSPDVLHPNDTLLLDLYIRGNHPANPALLVTAADSLRAKRLGHVEIYPGMAATDTLPDDTLWRVPVRVPLDTIPDQAVMPRLITVLVEFVNLEDNQKILFDNDKSLLEVFGPTLHDERYQAAGRHTDTDIRFGDIITLDGYNTHTADTGFVAGSTVNLSFTWLPTEDISADWTLTLQLFDANGELAAQEDGMPYWYPTSAWVPGVKFIDERRITLPEDIPAGDYSLRLGWYRQTESGQFERLPITDAASADNLYTLPEAITILAPQTETP